jgi:hypothetical protein
VLAHKSTSLTQSLSFLSLKTTQSTTKLLEILLYFWYGTESSKLQCSSFSQRKFGYYNKCNTTHPECIVLAVDGVLVIDASLTRLTIFSLSSTLESPLPLDLKSLHRVLDLISSHLPCNQGTNCRVHSSANSVLQHQTAGRIEIASQLN